MAEDNFKARRYERSDRQKYMEHNFASALGGPDSVMKFSPQRLESPPPKPPRRRYSDQLSVQSLGNYSSLKKTNDENQRNDSKLKRCNPKPAYLSLPANLTSNVLNECDVSSDLLSHPPSLSDQLKHLKENELYAKSFLDNLKICPKQLYASYKFSNKEKSHSVIPEADSNQISSKCQHECLAPSTSDTFPRNSISNNKVFMTNTHIKQNLKSIPKECHRRHHSDPAISYFNLQSDNSVKLSSEQCCKKSYFIMQEMKILKEINDKLWNHMCSLQMYLENSRKKVDECADISVSGLLTNIYYAQKTKDSAMEERLKLVLEERDAAVHELEDLINSLSKHFDYAVAEKEVDKDMKELLGEMESIMNPSKFLKYQRLLLNHIQSFKESKECQSPKVKQTMIERDNALKKIKNLEEEIKDMKLCYDLWHADNKHWEFTMFDIINQVMNQRDALLSKVDNGFDIGNVVYRPLATNKLDSIDYQNISYESRSKTIESLKNHQAVNLSDKQQHSISTSEEIMELKEEVLLLNKALEGERKRREHAEEKCLRLERLIHILRKKLNGQNVGVPV